jgi:hypothetical protein
VISGLGLPLLAAPGFAGVVVAVFAVFAGAWRVTAAVVLAVVCGFFAAFLGTGLVAGLAGDSGLALRD